MSVERLSIEEAELNLKAAHAVLQDRLRKVNNPERYREKLTKEVERARAALQREEAELAAFEKLLSDRDTVLDALHARIKQAQDQKKMVIHLTAMERTRELFKQLKALGMDPLAGIGAGVTEDDIVS